MESDGFILRREFRMPIGVPQGVGLLADGRRAVISCGTGEPPIDILIADIETGEMRRLLTLERPGAHVKGRHILLSNELEL